MLLSWSDKQSANPLSWNCPLWEYPKRKRTICDEYIGFPSWNLAAQSSDINKNEKKRNKASILWYKLIENNAEIKIKAFIQVDCLFLCYIHHKRVIQNTLVLRFANNRLIESMELTEALQLLIEKRFLKEAEHNWDWDSYTYIYIVLWAYM